MLSQLVTQYLAYNQGVSSRTLTATDMADSQCFKESSSFYEELFLIHMREYRRTNPHCIQVLAVKFYLQSNKTTEQK